MLHIRRSLLLRDTVSSDMGKAGDRPIVRAVALAVIGNPFAGRYVEDLTELFEAGRSLGEQLMPEIVRLLPHSPVSYRQGPIAARACPGGAASRGGPPSAAAGRSFPRP